MRIRRGDIVIADLEPVIGSEQGMIRPVLVIQNNLSNENSPTTIIAPITTKLYTKEFPTNVVVSPEESGLKKKSTILLNQIRTIDKKRISKQVSSLESRLMVKVDKALAVSLGL